MLSIGFEFDLTRHAEERAQAREPARAVRRAGREGAFLRDRRVRPVHVRLRRRRPNTFQETARFNIEANYDAVAYSVLTPYPGTLTWYEMRRQTASSPSTGRNTIRGTSSTGRSKMTGEELRLGHIGAYKTFYSASSIARRFPYGGGTHMVEWSIYNLFMRKGSATDRKHVIAPPTPEPDLAPVPPLLPASSASGATPFWRRLAPRKKVTRQATAVHHGRDRARDC